MKKLLIRMVSFFSFIKKWRAAGILQNRNMKKTFQKIYETKYWDNPNNGGESLSGEGSIIKNTFLIREAITGILSEFNIKTMLDAGCGDWNWMKEISSFLPDYTGLDVAPFVIEGNKKYAKKNIRFINEASLSFLKRIKNKEFDLILIRHILEHLPTYYNIDLLNEVKRCSKYALITSTLQETPTTNKTEIFGGYAPINLLKTPYIEVLGKPLRQIDDYCIPEPRGITFINFYEFK